RSRYQAVWPALCWSEGWYSLADSGLAEMPLPDRSLLIAEATPTGSSPSPSRWLEISSGTVPSVFTVDSQVDHSPEFCPGVAESDGPMVVALGASFLTS